MLNKVKTLLGISLEDTDADDKLSIILDSASARLKLLLGGLEIPNSMEYILVDVTIMRFNRIGSEGFSSHSVEGESISFSNDDFAPYQEDIQAYLEGKQGIKRGRVRFL